MLFIPELIKRGIKYLRNFQYISLSTSDMKKFSENSVVREVEYNIAQ